MKVVRDAWVARNLANEDIVRFGISLERIAFDVSLLDGTVIKTRLDKKGYQHLGAGRCRRTSRRAEGFAFHQKYGRRGQSPWRQFFDDLDARGLAGPEFVIDDEAPGPEAALVAL